MPLLGVKRTYASPELLECRGLRRGGCTWPHEYNGGVHWNFRVLAGALADENEACSTIGHRQDDRFTRPCPDRLHPDDEKLTDWLVQVLKSQLRSDFCGRKSETQPLRARIDFGQRCCLALEAELSGRDRDELHVRFLATQSKSRPRKDFSSGASDVAAHCTHRLAKGAHVPERPYRNRLPQPNIGGRTDGSLRSLHRRSSLEVQVIAQNVLRGALSFGLASESEDKRATEQQGNNADVAFCRTIRPRDVSVRGDVIDLAARRADVHELPVAEAAQGRLCTPASTALPPCAQELLDEADNALR